MAYAAQEAITGTFILTRESGANITVDGLLLSAGTGATGTLEVYRGVRGLVDGVILGDGLGEDGTGYEVDDLVTVASPAVGGTDLILKILTVDTGGEVLTFEVVQAGTGFVDIESQATTGGSGTGFEVDIQVTNTEPVSIAKLVAVQNSSASFERCFLVTGGSLTVEVSGSGAQGYLYHS